MKAIIIDDEPHCRNVIARILEKFCPEVRVLAACEDGIEGLAAIKKFMPELIFLDIEMPRLNGFQMLEQLDSEELNFAIIFTTAYDKFAIKAFKFSAFDYLLKPIDETELVAAVKKLDRSINRKEQLEFLKNNQQKQTFNKIIVSSIKGFSFLDIEAIVAIEADSNYSTFHLQNGEKFLASKTLGHYEEILVERGFFRTHKHCMINLQHIKEYLGGDLNIILMTNDYQAKLSRTKRDEFLSIFS